MSDMFFKHSFSGGVAVAIEPAHPGIKKTGWANNDSIYYVRVTNIPVGTLAVDVVQKLRLTALMLDVFEVDYADLIPGKIIKAGPGRPPEHADHPFEVARLARDMTQAVFVATVFGVAPATYKRWISGTTDIPRRAELAFDHWQKAQSRDKKNGNHKKR